MATPVLHWMKQFCNVCKKTYFCTYNTLSFYISNHNLHRFQLKKKWTVEDQVCYPRRFLQGRLRLELFVWLVLQEEAISFCKNQKGAIIMIFFFQHISLQNYPQQFAPAVLWEQPSRGEHWRSRRPAWCSSLCWAVPPGQMLARRGQKAPHCRTCQAVPPPWAVAARSQRTVQEAAPLPCHGPCTSKCLAAGANQVVGNACIRFAPAKEMRLILLQIYPIMRSICYRTWFSTNQAFAS